MNEPQWSVELALNDAEDANGGAYVLLSKMAEVACDAIPPGWLRTRAGWVNLLDLHIDAYVRSKCDPDYINEEHG